MFKTSLFIFFLLIFTTRTTNAGTWSWSNSGYSMGSYVPINGSFSESIFYGQYVSTVNFTLDSSNVNSIGDYNDGDGQGGNCNDQEAFLTLDVTAVPNGWDLEIDANAVYSNLPNPHFDIESDFGSDPDDEESETVALGTVSNSTYYMTTYWIDNRDGGTNDGGNIQAQFAMSKEGVFDYNNCVTANGIQIINSYGKNYSDT